MEGEERDTQRICTNLDSFRGTGFNKHILNVEIMFAHKLERKVRIPLLLKNTYDFCGELYDVSATPCPSFPRSDHMEGEGDGE